MKKIKVWIVALALSMNAIEIKEMYDGADEIEFTEIMKLALNKKIKRYGPEAVELKKQLEAVMQIING